jgi:predicted MPP superfamily phosphohydrolase
MILSLILFCLLGITIASIKNKLTGKPVPHLLRSVKRTQIGFHEEQVTRFFVIEDFGDINASKDLNLITDPIDKISSTQHYDFIATVGDNIYEKGIDNMKDLSDADEIMKHFKKPSLGEIPMYLTLGKHDCYSDYKKKSVIVPSTPNGTWNLIIQ